MNFFKIRFAKPHDEQPLPFAQFVDDILMKGNYKTPSMCKSYDDHVSSLVACYTCF